MKTLRQSGRRIIGNIVFCVSLACAALAPTAGPVRAAAHAAPPLSHAASTDKMRFLADMGLGAYAAYYWVFQPWQGGQFTAGSSGQRLALSTAAIALGFAYTRFKAAYTIANQSHDPVLHALAAPLNKLNTHVDREHTYLSRGHYDSNDMQALYNETSTYCALTHTRGYAITQIPSRIPGLP